MKANPYLARNRSRFVMANTGEPIKDALKLGGSRELAVDRYGEINASSDKDLMIQIHNLVKAYQGGQIQRASTRENMALAEERRALVTAALADKTGPAWRVLGEVIGEEVQIAMDREGFARKLLMLKTLARGEDAKLRIRQKDVIAWQATTNPMVAASVVRQKWMYPKDFYLLARILIENKEIEQNTGDLLDEKYQDALEAIMVKEDRVCLNLMDSAASTSNDINYFNALTPAVFSSLRTSVQRWGLPVSTAVLAFDLWDDIIANSGFSEWFDPVSKHQLVLEGVLGEILGVQLITDAFREPNLQVLSAGTIYFCGAPQTVGGITQRTELSSEPIDTYATGAPNRGWFLQAIEGMAIVNSRSVAKGSKI